ncbi:hypothetical protein H0H92_007685, partial [Tricholoma furcatifolium]
IDHTLEIWAEGEKVKDGVNSKRDGSLNLKADEQFRCGGGSHAVSGWTEGSGGMLHACRTSFGA